MSFDRVYFKVFIIFLTHVTRIVSIWLVTKKDQLLSKELSKNMTKKLFLEEKLRKWMERRW